MSIIVPVLREGREERGGPFLFNRRACLVFVVLGGGVNYFYSKPYVEQQQMHIL